MTLKRAAFASVVVFGLAAVFTTVSANDISKFYSVWNSRKATPTEKQTAVDGLPQSGENLTKAYIEVLESDVWQYRRSVVARIQQETNESVLKELEKFLFDERSVHRQPAAGEHLAWAMYNNSVWATREKWDFATKMVKSKRYPEKVKARMIRELGQFRGAPQDADAQANARHNVRILVNLLAWQLDNERRASRNLLFLTVDSLENLTSEEHGRSLDKWEFFAGNMSEEEPLKPRTKDKFKDEFEDVDIEGHSFARRTPRPVDLEVLILPDLGSNDRYWYPYIFEINKTFKCTFVKLPDCSRMPDLEYLRRRDGTVDRSAYYYPLKQLVEAFEERRKQSGQEKIGLIAHGVSGWIALEYLRLYPESVSFATIIGTWSGKGSRGDAQNQTRNHGPEVYKWFAESLTYDPSGRTGQLSLDEDQKHMAQTGAYMREWADPKALEPIFYATREFREMPEGNARILVPEYEFEEAVGRQRIDVPVLFVHGEADPMFIPSDERIYQSSFTRMQWATFPQAGATPWAEQPVQFFEAFEKLLEDNEILEQLKEAEEKKKAEEEKAKK